MKKSFTPLVIVTTAATYLLIFVGGIVRVSGDGPGCPDWPRCFGRWGPPTNVSELPEDVAPESYNLVLAWIEYGNCLVGVVVGLLMVLACIVAAACFRRHRGILVATMLTLLLIGIQGWLGGRIVASELAPWMVSAHMGLAVLIVGLLIYAAQESWYVQRPVEVDAGTGALRRQLGVLWLLAAAQIVVGAGQRGTLEGLRGTLPLARDLELFNTLGVIKYIHFVLAASIVTVSVMLVVRVGRLQLRRSVRLGIYAVLLLVASQVLVGLAMGRFGLAPILQLLHLWIGTIFVGLVMSLYLAVPVRLVNRGPAPGTVVRVAMPTAAVMFFLLLAALLVIRQAEASRRQVPAYRNIPTFEFVSQHGGPFGTDQFTGRISVVDFFFTRCGAQCPRMTLEMRKLYELYDGSDKVQFVSISVDASFDTPEVLADYAEKYEVSGDRWAFLHGPQSDVDSLCETGFALSADNPMHHSPKFILVDQQGTIRGYYDIDIPTDMKRLREHIVILAQRGR
ncbi:MAG: COX15/CtaA family protein [Lentisphaeria bacterium]|jgi:cytochrome c oxidase assembly protein subunit 15|nr:COX15/CtaA family protein [Lentisphaeria bacterium]MDP7741664.1 COX15/CtaA family protein [Lentisphaeria bacterium]